MSPLQQEQEAPMSSAGVEEVLVYLDGGNGWHAWLPDRSLEAWCTWGHERGQVYLYRGEGATHTTMRPGGWAAAAHIQGKGVLVFTRVRLLPEDLARRATNGFVRAVEHVLRNDGAPPGAPTVHGERG